MTIVIPEAQLQAYVLGLVRDALPHEPPDSFCVEKWLKLRLGHSEYEEDGAAKWEADGRADLVVYHAGRPLAVFELKREDKSLTYSDVDQARSYASVMLDRPPLVIISNGKETWVRQSSDGLPLETGLEGGEFVEKLFANIGKLSASNNSWAIEALMGPESSVWVEAVRRRTDELIERLTGEPDDTRKPFGRDLLFHRSAVSEIVSFLESGARAVLVEGPPLIGKSSVLRGLALECRASTEWAVLMVNAAVHGPGLFQRLANIFGSALEWRLSADDVRTWIRRMSRSSRRPALVIVVDGIRPGSDVASDIEELAEAGFGDALRIVATADRASELLLDAGGRGESALSSIAKVVTVGLLDDDEFGFLRQQLAQQRLHFYGGAELSREYRMGWVLRSILSGGKAPDNDEHAAMIPATMGLATIHVARQRLNGLGEVSRLHRLIARDVLADMEEPGPELALSQANAFVFRRDALSSLGEAAASSLEKLGWVNFFRHPTGEDVVLFRAPMFIMSELASELARIVDELIDGAEEAATHLIWQAQRLFLGDLVGAQALVDLMVQRKTLPTKLFALLMNDSPDTESMAGKLISTERDDGEVITLRFDEEGRVARADSEGNLLEPYVSLEADGNEPLMLGNMTSWMILSQLARIPSAFGKQTTERFDVEIMLHVGRSIIPLLRGDTELTSLHEMQEFGDAGTGLSPSQALAEPLTAAIHKLFAQEWRELGMFFDRLEAAGSLPLTVRVHNALLGLRGSADDECDAWAEATLSSIICPLLRTQIAAIE